MEKENPDSVRSQLLSLLSSLPLSDAERTQTLVNFGKIVKTYKRKHRG
nr:MAG TPA: hypothetical protein [Bacteriophage sp.]